MIELDGLDSSYIIWCILLVVATIVLCSNNGGTP